jgi:hypothetical protein
MRRELRQIVEMGPRPFQAIADELGSLLEGYLPPTVAFHDLARSARPLADARGGAPRDSGGVEDNPGDGQIG